MILSLRDLQLSYFVVSKIKIVTLTTVHHLYVVLQVILHCSLNLLIKYNFLFATQKVA